MSGASVGGLAKNRHKNKRGGGGGTGGIGSGKIPVVGAVKRKGNVIARVMENVRAATLPDKVDRDQRDITIISDLLT